MEEHYRLIPIRIALWNSRQNGNKNKHMLWYVIPTPSKIAKWFAIIKHKCFLNHTSSNDQFGGVDTDCRRYSADDHQVCLECMCWDHKHVYFWAIVMMAEGGNSWFVMPSILEVIVIYIEQKRPSVRVSMIWLECIKLKSTIVRTRTDLLRYSLRMEQKGE